ncbi:MAG: hypothetical protein KGJ98_13105, partial [Chloroflexota bacterium]|nr:hypothetical protein [Chloroflexota bacterium]
MERGGGKGPHRPIKTASPSVAPTATATPAPAAGLTATPSPTPAPTATPTPTQAASPTPTPAPTPTPSATASPTASPAPTPSPASGVSVTSFGAVADGKTDDTAAIQAAANAAGTNGSIYFPPGTYYFASALYMNIRGQTWTLQSGATLRAGNTIYLQAASVTLAGPGAIDEQGATRLGVRIDYNGTAAAPGGDGDVVDGVEMYNMGPPWGAFVFANGDYATVEKCYFHDALSDAAMIDTDGGPGHTGISFLSDRF